MATTTLCETFVRELPERLRSTVEPGDLEVLLGELLGVARHAWPDLHVVASEFVRRLARSAATDDVAAALKQLRVGDLYLACACGAGDPGAIRAFEAEVLPQVDRALAKLRLPVDLADEVRQRVRCTLLVASTRDHSGLATYSGRGDLRKWVVAVSVRETFKTLRRETRARRMAQGEAMVRLVPPQQDPELAYLEEVYAAEFQAALQVALDGLTSRERNLLRQQLLDGLTMVQLATLYGVNRATVVRWLSSARRRLLRETRRELMWRLRTTRSDVSSIMRLVRCRRLDISLHDLLAADRG